MTGIQFKNIASAQSSSSDGCSYAVIPAKQPGSGSWWSSEVAHNRKRNFRKTPGYL